jgi:hypothetical protein
MKKIFLIFLILVLCLVFSILAIATTETLRPDGNGSEIAITSQYPDADSHFDKIDEATTDDADYVFDTGTTAVYHRDLYTVANSAIGAGVINSVTVYTRTCTEVSGYNVQQISLRTESTTYNYDINVGNQGAFHERNTGALTVNPKTAAAWTWTEINALEIGGNIRGWSASGNPGISQVWVVIDYTPAPSVNNAIIFGINF